MKTSGRLVRLSVFRIRRALLWSGVAALPALSSLGFGATIPDDSASKAAFGALTKLAQTPNHQYVMSVAEEGSAGPKRESELISTDTTVYIKVNGKWKASRMTPKDWADQEKENIENAKVIRCAYERDETVNGEATAIYKTHSETEDDSSDSEVWVSKRSGLPLRMIISMNGKPSKSVRFEYTNIKAPPLG